MISVSDNLECACVCSVTKLCLILCDPMDCSPPGSSVHGDFPDKNSSCRGFSQPRDQICVFWVSCVGRQILYHWATQEPNLECTQSQYPVFVETQFHNFTLILFLGFWFPILMAYIVHQILSAGASAFCQSPFQELELCWASPWSWLPPFLNSTFHLSHLP